MTQITKNVFNKGLSRDYDPSNVTAYSMVDNINGRIMFNKNGTLDWVEDNGNQYSWTLNADSGNDPNRYIPIGYAGDGNIKIIFSVSSSPITTGPNAGPNNFYSEIGILGVNEDGVGSYETLFNDQNDINNELLEFRPENQICARFLYENDKTIRVYWVDGVRKASAPLKESKPPRVFTFEFDNTINAPRNDVSAYSPVTSTVHSINSQAEFQPGIIKYRRTISGDILTGVYQYTYRLLTLDGYATPWTTPTKKVFVTSDAVSNVNWNDYEMEGSGVNSGKGNEIQVKGIDQRYDRIQVAYMYSETNTEVLESSIFVDTAIDKTAGGDIEIFQHTANGGEPVLLDEIAARFQGIAAAKTLEMKDSVLYYGNIVENFLNISNTELENILSGLTITPKFRDMLSDTRSLGPINPPVTHHQVFPSGSLTKRYNQSATEDFLIENDYVNYKGTQVEHEFTGYFRGETYRFAIVFYDKLGYPFFAFHLADFTFPQQHDTQYSWQRIRLDGTLTAVTTANLAVPAVPTNDYNHAPLNNTPVLNADPYYNSSYSHLRIMGIEVSGIDVSAISSKISGFSIVRTERDGSILTQGIILPTLIDPGATDVTRPHSVGHQRFGIGGSTVSAPELFGIQETGISNDKFRSRPNTSMLYAPDTDFDGANKPIVQTVDRLKIVGSCYKEINTIDTDLQIDAGSGNNAPNFTYRDDEPSGNDKSPCIVSKWYRTYNTWHDTAPSSSFRPAYGDEANIEYDFLVGLGGEIDDYEGALDFHNSIIYDTDSSPNTEGFGDEDEYKGWGKPNSWVLKHSNWSNGSPSSIFYYNGSSSLAYSTQAGALICNYLRPNNNPYGGLTLSSIQQSIFFSTGHFQPVGNSTFTTPGTNIYNQIEIFGGDCYLDYFGFLRIYGRYSDPDDDISYAIVFPFESTINHSMRQAQSTQNPMYTDVAARPWKEVDVPGSTNWPDGLFTNSPAELREEFNYNDVLTFGELNNFFISRPINFQDINDYPVRWRHTLNKFYGDPIDSWRQFQTNDFQDLTGQYGAITSSGFLFNQIYSWQESAFGRLRAFDRAALESENTASLTTGIGPALDGIDYISTAVGNQHQWSMVNTGKAAYWIDVFNGKAMKFAQDGLVFLSDVRGMHTFFTEQSKFFLNKDNPVRGEGISSVWDAKNREVLWTFNRDEYVSVNATIRVISDIPDAINYWGNNETVFIDYSGPTGPSNGLILPIGSTASGNNFNTLQYVASSSNSVNMWVNMDDGVTVTPLVQILPGEFYLFFRNTETDAWQFIQVTKREITPFRATIVYSEYITAFSQFHSFKPNFYISHNKWVLSEQADVVARDFYVHGKNLNVATYYGEQWKTMLKLSVSENSEFAKLYDNVRVAINQSGNDTMSRFVFQTETQNRYYNVQADTRVKYLENNMRLPIRTLDQANRARGRWLEMTKEFLNNSQYPAKINNFITHYRVSNRR